MYLENLLDVRIFSAHLKVKIEGPMHTDVIEIKLAHIKRWSRGRYSLQSYWDVNIYDDIQIQSMGT